MVVDGVGVSEPAIGLSYSFTVDDKRSVVMQTFVSRDCSVADLNAALDKMADAGHRQMARATRTALKKSLQLQTKQLRRVTEDLMRIDEMAMASWKGSGKKGEYKRSSEQDNHRKNVLVTQDRFKEEIADLEREILEAEAVLHHGANGD